MPASFTGYPGAVRYHGRWGFDPAVGETLEHSWHGPKAAIFALYSAFKAAGVRADVSNRGPVYMLTAEIAPLINEGEETPLDDWEIDHEMAQVSIFNVPEVTAEAKTYTSLAKYRKDIEEAVRKGDPAPPMYKAGSPPLFPVSLAVYIELARGNEAIELDRIVLRRVRHYSAKYAQRAVLTVLPTVYKTAALVRQFAPVPPVIQAQLPADPTTAPDYTVWAWKVRRDRSVPVPRLNKIKEEKEWVFAAWAELNHLIMLT